MEENKNEKARETTQRKNRWDSNLEGVYRNRHLSGQRENSRQSHNISRDYLTMKYRDQSPPIRDNSLIKYTEGSVENKENRDSNRDFNTEQSELAQVYNIFKYTMQRKESVRPQSVSSVSRPNSVLRGTSNEKKNETKDEVVRKENNYFLKGIQPKPNKRLLADCFEELKIIYLRKKRLSQKVMTLQYIIFSSIRSNVNRMRFREKAIDKSIRRWRNYIKHVKAGNIAEEEYNELYAQKLLSKYFKSWVCIFLETFLIRLIEIKS